jgi:hypothetical protein
MHESLGWISARGRASGEKRRRSAEERDVEDVRREVRGGRESLPRQKAMRRQ